MNTVLEKERKKKPVKKRLTVNEYELMPNNGKVLQLIDGDFVMTPAPTLKHQEVSRNIEKYFLDYLDKNPIGKILDAPIDFHIDKYNVVQPDLAYISKARYTVLFEKGIRGAPDIVIEILSPHTKRTDRKLKKKLYYKVGVKEYWIVDIDDECIEVFRKRTDDYELDNTYRKDNNDILPCTLLKGLEIDLQTVFYYDWI